MKVMATNSVFRAAAVQIHLLLFSMSIVSSTIYISTYLNRSCGEGTFLEGLSILGNYFNRVY